MVHAKIRKELSVGGNRTPVPIALAPKGCQPDFQRLGGGSGEAKDDVQYSVVMS